MPRHLIVPLVSSVISLRCFRPQTNAKHKHQCTTCPHTCSALPVSSARAVARVRRNNRAFMKMLIAETCSATGARRAAKLSVCSHHMRCNMRVLGLVEIRGARGDGAYRSVSATTRHRSCCFFERCDPGLETAPKVTGAPGKMDTNNMFPVSQEASHASLAAAPLTDSR